MERKYCCHNYNNGLCITCGKNQKCKICEDNYPYKKISCSFCKENIICSKCINKCKKCNIVVCLACIEDKYNCNCNNIHLCSENTCPCNWIYECYECKKKICDCDSCCDISRNDDGHPFYYCKSCYKKFFVL